MFIPVFFENNYRYKKANNRVLGKNEMEQASESFKWEQ